MARADTYKLLVDVIEAADDPSRVSPLYTPAVNGVLTGETRQNSKKT